MSDLFFPKAAFDESLRAQLGDRKLTSRYIVPPFSVLDAKAGYWQDRKRLWLSLGIQSEVGRGTNLLSTGAHSVFDGTSEWSGTRGSKTKIGKVSPGGSPRPAMKLGKNGRTLRGDGKGRELKAQAFSCAGPGGLGKRYDASPYGAYKSSDETSEKIQAAQQGTGTSIFDPVLCELFYRWFCPAGGSVLDPFAGGSVRGIVASVLGLDYTGIDLRQNQVDANNAQAEQIVPDKKPTWIVGDSLDVKKHCKNKLYDGVFSCPPYGALERYCDDPRDLSNMEYDKFMETYSAIIRRSLCLLKDDSFACFVVGDFRDKETHFYKHFPQHTVEAFENAGAMLYNEAILLTAVGSLPLRASFQFDRSRKLGRTHQYVLTFVKGDWRRATEKVVGKIQEEVEDGANDNVEGDA